MITPRRTRLIRVADLQAFRSATLALSSTMDPDAAQATAIVVPTRGAARQLRRTLENRLLASRGPRALVLPNIVTRDRLYDLLQSKLLPAVRPLSAYERDAIFRAAAREASRAFPPPFRIRPGLVAEAVRFYDQLRRQRQSVDRFEQLLVESLERDVDLDRGAARMLEQTRFLAATFRAYERQVSDLSASDEHTLRERLIANEAQLPVRRTIVTVADWIADPSGLYAADFDLLTRLPGLEEIDVVATERLLASGFHQRLHDWLPDIEETDGPGERLAQARPILRAPRGDDRLWFEHRDREEELVAIARRLKSNPPEALDRCAVVFRRPLPYLYLARAVFGSAGIPYETQDALPLAAEPYAAALDLVLTAAAAQFSRDSLVALLRSPHVSFGNVGCAASPQAIAALDRRLSEARYLGEPDRLRTLAAGRAPDLATPAFETALAVIDALEPLTRPRPISQQLATLREALRQAGEGIELSSRTLRSQAAVFSLLDSLSAACAAHENPDVTIETLSAEVRRWVEEQTFVPESSESGVQVIDAQAARYGDLDEVAIVGLIDGEWPERPRRNVFYPPALLAALGWAPEVDRQGADTAAFVDLLGSAARRVEVSAFSLDDEALVEPSILVDEIESAGLTVVREPALAASRVFAEEALSLEPVVTAVLDLPARDWAALRIGRTSIASDEFHGAVGSRAPRPLSVSSMERYLRCPFQFFAQHVLRLEEEPVDDEVMDPRRQGAFIHSVFEAFFREWQARGHRRIEAGDLDAARALFARVAEDALVQLPEAEASIERTRLLGSPVAPGLGDCVFRMESERTADVEERLLEYKLEGTFRFVDDNGPRSIALRGVADRIDLLADGTFRLIDYKLSSAPDKSRALQLPIYGICAEQQLDGHRGRTWRLGEAAYIAFRGSKGSRRVTPLFTARAGRDEVLGAAQARMIAAVDAIEAGRFPPTPEDVFFCDFCSYSTVCRKDYVGDV